MDHDQRKMNATHIVYASWLMLLTIIGGVYLTTSNRLDALFFFARHRTGFLDALFVTATRLAEAPGFILCGCIALAVRWVHFLPIAAAGALAYATSEILKSWFRASRPADVLVESGLLNKLNTVAGVFLQSGPTSFPSGHATAAFTLAGVMILFFKPDPLITSLIFIIAVVAAISRMYLVQHFAVDVYAGAMVGTLLAVLLYQFARRAGIQ